MFLAKPFHSLNLIFSPLADTSGSVRYHTILISKHKVSRVPCIKILSLNFWFPCETIPTYYLAKRNDNLTRCIFNKIWGRKKCQNIMVWIQCRGIVLILFYYSYFGFGQNKTGKVLFYVNVILCLEWTISRCLMHIFTRSHNEDFKHMLRKFSP